MKKKLTHTVAFVAGIGTAAIFNPTSPVPAVAPQQLAGDFEDIGENRIEAELRQQLLDANAVEVTCASGRLSNKPEAVYCTDDKTAGFILSKKVMGGDTLDGGIKIRLYNGKAQVAQ